MRAAGLVALVVAAGPGREPPRTDPLLVHGMTISCQTWGREWASPGFADELDDLAALGVNWIAIHPYARVDGDGSVRWRSLEDEGVRAHLTEPLRVARAKGFSVLVKPHLAYWGSPFPWRGAIDFPDGAARARFWREYGAWMEAVAGLTRGADALAVGTELDRLVGDEAEWRGLIERLRRATDAHLTYAANWDAYERVPFWDALDAIGVQGYFPLSTAEAPGDEDLRAGWRAAVEPLRALSRRTGKPVVLTELGYDVSLAAAREPWRDGRVSAAERERAAALQERCLRVALEELERERAWLRGAFLWKWFVGPAPGETFLLDRPGPRDVIARTWAVR